MHIIRPNMIQVKKYYTFRREVHVQWNIEAKLKNVNGEKMFKNVSIRLVNSL